MLTIEDHVSSSKLIVSKFPLSILILGQKTSTTEPTLTTTQDWWEPVPSSVPTPLSRQLAIFGLIDFTRIIKYHLDTQRRIECLSSYKELPRLCSLECFYFDSKVTKKTRLYRLLSLEAMKKIKITSLTYFSKMSFFYFFQF